jgi:hypothetical protein
MHVLLVVAVNLMFPALILELALAVPVFVIARRRKVSAIRWTLLNFIPLVEWVFSIAFYAATVLSILDRLNRLETERSFA